MIKDAIKAIQARRFAQAEQLLRTQLQQHPKEARSHHLLAIVYAEMGKLDAAELHFQSAIELIPQQPEFWRDYALCLQRKENLDFALKAISRAIELRPSHTPFLVDQARVLYAKEDFETALRTLETAVSLTPNSADAHFDMGVILHEQERLPQALTHLERVVALIPQHAAGWSHLAGVYFKLGRLRDAEQAFRKELQIRPDSVQAWSHLGNVRLKMGSPDAALQCYKKALSLDANRAETWFNLGNALSRKASYAEAEPAFQKCLELDPKHGSAMAELAGVYLAKGKTQEAIEHYRLACDEKNEPTFYSNFLYALHLRDPQDPDNELKCLQQYGRRHALSHVYQSYHAKGQNNKLHIGMVSPDFRRHSVSYFVEPILDKYDRDAFEISCYQINWEQDEVTERLRNYVDHWIEAAPLTDEHLAARIHEDRIDCLIDLAGHTGNNRLPIFTARPAPVQLTFLGFSGSTGLSEIDYFITDCKANPPESQAYCTEQLACMPHSYFCYRPPAKSPAVSPLPADLNGLVTFGCFNNRAKLSVRAMETWSEILRRVPNSRLLLKNRSVADPRTAESLRDFLRERGVDEHKFKVQTPQASNNEHLAAYQQVDIALDSFPYNGATTTCEALWMGVPVISLAGQTHVARMGLSILSAIGLSEFVAYSEQDYIDLCVRLANSIDQLRTLRAGMRDRLISSALMDEVGYTRALENLLQTLAGRSRGADGHS